MTSIELVKPTFGTSDETSISITSIFSSSEATTLALTENRIRLQYKLPHEPWDQAKSVIMAISTGKEGKVREVGKETNVEAVLSSVIMEDLNPGTPYAVRFIVVDSNNNIIQTGPDTVYDTSPVDCGPKKKSCVLS